MDEQDFESSTSANSITSASTKKVYNNFYRDEDYPVFVKAGSIIPMNNNIKEDIVFLLNNTGLVISVKWSKNDKTIKGVFGGIVLTNRDAYYLIDDNLVPTFFILEKN